MEQNPIEKIWDGLSVFNKSSTDKNDNKRNNPAPYPNIASVYSSSENDKKIIVPNLESRK